MLNSWFNLAFLATEAHHVICLRMMRLGYGGTAAQEEAYRMVSEKMTAGMQAGFGLMLGRSPDRIVSNVRRTVRANAARLASPLRP